MPFRYTPNQKKKNPYIKWSLIIVPILLVIAAASWYFLQTQNSASSVENTAESKVQPSVPVAEEKIEVPKKTQAVEEPKKPEEPVQVEVKEKPETPQEQKKEEEPAAVEPKEPEAVKDAAQYSETIELPKAPTVINGILLANKQHPMPKTYAPGEVKEARSAFESMRKKALEEGIDLVAFSTYRDFARQTQLYNGYVAKDGQEAADRYSARPGYSEHQSGLAFDIGEAGQEKHWAAASFGDTKGGKWLAKNAHNYGYILRYPKGSESITGYMHESWHYRYVGKKAATEIYQKGITLEEYLGV